MALTAAMAVLCRPAPSLAGPLDPPAGPIAPTGKVIGEIEPRIAINDTNTPGDADSRFKISAPGSYYLTGEVQGVVGKHGIEVVASGVTIDLNGFTVRGAAATFSGIRSTAACENVTVRNGHVIGWGVEGISLNFTGSASCVVENVTISGNLGNGVSLGPNSMILGCASSDNDGNGFSLTFNTVASQCTASSNRLAGFLFGFSASVVNCAAYLNEGNGFTSGNGATFSSCSSRDNLGIGFSANSGCTISDCAAQSNDSLGYALQSGSTISNSSANGNGQDGVVAGSNCTILFCTMVGNGQGTLGGAGIRITGTRNRVEGNVCNTADRGIDVDGANNVIIRNTCGGNTLNWDIVANNIVGPIIDRSSVVAAAISGNTAPSSLGSTDANANFTY